MKGVLQKRSRRVATLGIMSWVVGANAAAAFGQHLNQIMTAAIGDSIGSQVLQSASLLAGMNSDELGCNSIALQIAGAVVSSTVLSVCPYLFSGYSRIGLWCQRPDSRAIAIGSPVGFR